MHKLMEILVYILALMGLACVVKHIMQSKKSLSGWHKIKIEDERSNDETVPPDVKAEDKERIGKTAIQFQSKGIFNFTFI